MYWQIFFDRFLDELFPRACLACGQEGVDACVTCLQALPQQPGCVTLDGLPVFYSYEYHESGVGPYIEAWKYHGSQSFIDAWFHLIPSPDLSDIDVVVPVPLHRRRLLERGFNQAEQLGRAISKRLNASMAQAIKRSRYTKPQAQCDGDERRVNVDQAFTCLGLDLWGKRVLLVDDVVTTGSTLHACARALRQAGAAEIQAFCLARGGSQNG